MKTKTIKRTIVKKLNEWLATIEDVTLRDQVRDNLLVSGGCIASMLTKEPVNDFDVYIKDMDVLIRLANYYCLGKVLDGRKRDQYIKDRFPDIENYEGNFLDSEEKYTSKEFVKISNLKKDQVKLDVESMGLRIPFKERVFEKLEDGTEVITSGTGKYQPVFLSQNAISLSDDIQIVLRFHGDAEQIHKTFDFIHATNYFTFKDGLVLNPAALESLLTKTLVYQGSLYPLTSIIRMKKFLGRGFTINAGEILKIMFQISELDLKDIEVLEEQLIGVDVAYFALLLDALRGVDPNKLTSKYINEMIDRIFNEYEEEDFN